MSKYIMLCLFLFTTAIMAATTGRIAGMVSDKETGEPLPGVNVIIDGTTMGGATNLEGEYFINRVPPGTYRVRASLIGYNDQVIDGIVVNIDRTTTAHFQISQTVLDAGQEVVVTAEREKIKMDISFSQTAIVAQEVSSAPTGTDIRAVIDMAPSIDRHEDTGNIIIRGSCR